MLNFGFSGLEKIAISLIGASVLFFAGYYKGYKAENARFVDFKNEIAAKAQAQKEVVAQIEQKQKIITEGIENEYKAKLSALELRYRRLHNSSGKPEVSRIPEAARAAYEASQDFVLDCANTTQQLVSLQQWLIQQKTAQ